METQDAYKQKMSAQLKEWNAQINLLEAKVANAAADIKVKRSEDLQALRIKQRAASEQMKALGKSSGEAWDHLTLTADKIWEDLKSGITEAQSKFK
ncbi:MAG: sll1863 family stress response protein [Burkholderiales bacterium]|nr:hypothetical protein [Ferrovum sp.]